MREMARKMPYLDYLGSLLPQQRREAIYYLSDLAWRANPGALAGNPLFIDHPKLAPELQARNKEVGHKRPLS
jgi:hypothetical protein